MVLTPVLRNIAKQDELQPISANGQQKAKCKRCHRTYATGDNETTSLLRHVKKCPKRDNDNDDEQLVDHHHPLD